MKNKNNRIIRALIIMLLCTVLTLGVGINSYAEEGEETYTSETVEDISGEVVTKNEEETTPSGDYIDGSKEIIEESGDYTQNLFEEIYKSLENNADKIFSVLAFIGTLVVGVGYKSGLLPLLRDAITKLKGSIDGVKAEGEAREQVNVQRLAEISGAVERIENQLLQIDDERADYNKMRRERESLGRILEGQIDMLYAIFMSSALPQYQKDEIGERISDMREELKSYEASKKN